MVIISSRPVPARVWRWRESSWKSRDEQGQNSAPTEKTEQTKELRVTWELGQRRQAHYRLDYASVTHLAE